MLATKRDRFLYVSSRLPVEIVPPCIVFPRAKKHMPMDAPVESQGFAMDPSGWVTKETFEVSNI